MIHENRILRYKNFYANIEQKKYLRSFLMLGMASCDILIQVSVISDKIPILLTCGTIWAVMALV
jgi:hypothetical protein